LSSGSTAAASSGEGSNVQYDLTLRYGITPRCFYVRGEYRSFHTTKTHSGYKAWLKSRSAAGP
jgi:hypothetical protein